MMTQAATVTTVSLGMVSSPKRMESHLMLTSEEGVLGLAENRSIAPFCSRKETPMAVMSTARDSA